MRGGHATPADRSDTEEFVTVLDEVGIRAGESVYADKGYSEPQTCWLPVGWVILPFFLCGLSSRDQGQIYPFLIRAVNAKYRSGTQRVRHFFAAAYAAKGDLASLSIPSSGGKRSVRSFFEA